MSHDTDRCVSSQLDKTVVITVSVPQPRSSLPQLFSPDHYHCTRRFRLPPWSQAILMAPVPSVTHLILIPALLQTQAHLRCSVALQILVDIFMLRNLAFAHAPKVLG